MLIEWDLKFTSLTFSENKCQDFRSRFHNVESSMKIGESIFYIIKHALINLNSHSINIVTSELINFQENDPWYFSEYLPQTILK